MSTMGRQVTMRSRLNIPIVDSIHMAIDCKINQYRMQSIEAFGINISVYPTEGSQPVIDLDGSFLGFNEYNFETFGQKAKAMAVRINAKGSVRLWYNQQWSRISHYLENLKSVDEWKEASGVAKNELKLSRMGQQSRWWKANGKKFRLMDLPSEIREIIYGFAFGDKIEPYPTCKARRLGPNIGSMLARKANSNILYTSRQVYVEASNILHMYTPFFVEHFGVTGPLLSNIPQRSGIRQLELALTHDDFFRFFGGKPSEDGTIRGPSRAAKALRSMRLNRLELKIAPPSLTTETEWLDGACQKTLVDWILSMAWPWVRGHPVAITGFVKTKQKTVFETACLAEKKRFELWQKQNLAVEVDAGDLVVYDEWLEEMDREDGGVRLDGKAKEDRAETGTVEITEWTPICFCKTPCTLKAWSAEG